MSRKYTVERKVETFSSYVRASTNSLILRSLDLSNKSYQRHEKYTCFELSCLAQHQNI